jgi:hypothetical protein
MMVVGMGDSGETYAGGGDLRQFNLGLLTSLRDSLYNVIDGGFHTHTNVVCCFGAAFADDFPIVDSNGRATIGSTPVNA